MHKDVIKIYLHWINLVKMKKFVRVTDATSHNARFALRRGRAAPPGLRRARSLRYASFPRPPAPAFLRRWKPTVSFIATQKRRKPFCYVPFVHVLFVNVGGLYVFGYYGLCKGRNCDGG
jgi:hypothetical protein